MSESQLQIVISVLNNAAGQLAEVGAQLGTLGAETEAAAETMQNSLSAAEEQIVASAQEVVSAWSGASDEIAADFEEIVPRVEEVLGSLADVNETAAMQVSAAWQAQGKAMEEDLAAALATMEEDTDAAADQMTEKVGSSGNSIHGYFQGLIAAFAMEQVGGALLGGVEDTVNAAAGNADKVTQLTDQINQQRAAIAQHQAELQKWLGTTASVNASHQAAAADIAAEKDKIQELQQQLGPLLAQQEAGGANAKAYADAVTQLNTNWQTFMATTGDTLLPLLTKIAVILDDWITKISALAAAHPKLTEELLIFVGVLGAILVVAGSVVAAFFIITVVVGVIGGAFVAMGAAIAIAVAYIVAYLVTNWSKIKTDVDNFVVAFKAVWNDLASWWLVYWNGIYTTIEGVWGKIQAIINSIKSAVGSVTGAVGGLAGSVGSSISGAAGSVMSAIHVNDAIITPNGQLIQTDAADYIFATKNPGALAGGGGNIQVFIQGGNYLDSNGATMIANALATQIQRQIRLKAYA